MHNLGSMPVRLLWLLHHVFLALLAYQLLRTCITLLVLSPATSGRDGASAKHATQAAIDCHGQRRSDTSSPNTRLPRIPVSLVA